MFLKKSVANNSATEPNKSEELNPPDDSNLSSEGLSPHFTEHEVSIGLTDFIKMCYWFLS